MTVSRRLLAPGPSCCTPNSRLGKAVEGGSFLAMIWSMEAFFEYPPNGEPGLRLEAVHRQTIADSWPPGPLRTRRRFIGKIIFCLKGSSGSPIPIGLKVKLVSAPVGQ